MANGIITIASIVFSIALMPPENSLPTAPQLQNSSVKKQIRKKDTPAGIVANYGKYDFKFTSLDGRTYQLLQFGGKITLVNIWAPWCEPCKKETDGLVRLYNRYHLKGFEIIGIAIQTTAPEVLSFIQSHKVRWPVGIKDNITKLYKSVGIPASYLFSPDGNLIKEFIGYTDERALEAILGEALKKLPTKKP